MRPHLFRRGNGIQPNKEGDSQPGFNEAPPIQAGKPSLLGWKATVMSRFNEAPPIQVGKLAVSAHQVPGARIASMRPHLFRRGNVSADSDNRAQGQPASMRPHLFRRGNAYSDSANAFQGAMLQ